FCCYHPSQIALWGSSANQFEMSMPNQLLRRPITADLALMNHNSRILALKDMQKKRARICRNICKANNY
ncbi:hypothetical protein MKX01_014083, partial [Papaver californicum]